MSIFDKYFFTDKGNYLTGKREEIKWAYILVRTLYQRRNFTHRRLFRLFITVKWRGPGGGCYYRYPTLKPNIYDYLLKEGNRMGWGASSILMKKSWCNFGWDSSMYSSSEIAYCGTLWWWENLYNHLKGSTVGIRELQYEWMNMFEIGGYFKQTRLIFSINSS